VLDPFDVASELPGAGLRPIPRGARPGSWDAATGRDPSV